MKMRCALLIVLLNLASALLIAGSASAGGLFIQEFGTPSHAMAGAGSNALADDASTAFHNAAGMTRLEDHEFQATAGVLIGDIKFDADSDTPYPGGGNGGQQGGPGPVLGSHYVHRITDRIRAGVALVSISGAILDPNNDWAGRFEVQKLELLTLSAIPSVAFKLHDTFSIGAGANLMYGTMDYKVAAPLPGPGQREGKIKFDDLSDFQPGAMVSAHWTPTEETRVGVVWSQEIELELEGDIKLKGIGIQADLRTDIPFAQFVHAAAVHQLTPDLLLAASFRWEHWSKFDNQFIKVSGVQGSLERNWDDTFGGSLGSQYRLDDRWKLLGASATTARPSRPEIALRTCRSTSRRGRLSACSTSSRTRCTSEATSATPGSAERGSSATR